MSRDSKKALPHSLPSSFPAPPSVHFPSPFLLPLPRLHEDAGNRGPPFFLAFYPIPGKGITLMSYLVDDIENVRDRHGVLWVVEMQWVGLVLLQSGLQRSERKVGHPKESNLIL